MNELMIKDIEECIEKYKYGEFMYHYTSVPVLYSILKHKEFWLGSTATMNDSKEVKHFIELLRDELREEIHTKISADMLSQFDIFFDNVIRRIDKEYPYAMCFSKLVDDSAQWERYADDGKGVCIIINTRKFMCAFCEAYILFGNVFYDFDIKQHQHYRILYDYFTTGQLSDFDNEKGQIDNAIACGYVHKHRSFKSEQEIRMVNLWNHVPKYAKLETECISGIIKRVMKIDVEKRCAEVGLSFEELFEGIIIGPKSRQDIVSLQSYIEECGYNGLIGKVSKSDCPLR